MKTFEELSKEEYLDWRNNEVTQAIFNHIGTVRNSFAEQVLSGATLGDGTIERTARAVGNIEGLDYLLNIEFEGEVDV